MRNWQYALMLCVTTGLFSQQVVLASDLDEGTKLYTAKEYSKALPFLEKAAQFSPMSWQPHYYLANTNLALGRMSAAKYEYELCQRAAGNNAAVVAKCKEGIARAERHTSQRPSAPAAAKSSEEKSDEAPKTSDAQVAASRRREEIMKHAREAVAKVRQEAKEQLEHEKSNANQFYRYEDGHIGTDVSDERENELQRETEEKCKRIMHEAEARTRSVGGP